jgi:hypothetical protein
MTDNEARRHAIAVWLMEFSVLWGVFPLLDQLIQKQPIDLQLTALSVGISLTTFLLGVMLTKGDSK